MLDFGKRCPLRLYFVEGLPVNGLVFVHSRRLRASRKHARQPIPMGFIIRSSAFTQDRGALRARPDCNEPHGNNDQLSTRVPRLMTYLSAAVWFCLRHSLILDGCHARVNK